MTSLNVEKLADVIMAEWLDRQGDSGSFWKESGLARSLAAEENGQELIEQAYRIAYDRYEGLGHA
jgi:hypothetical protein